MNEEFVVKTSVWKTIQFSISCLLLVIVGVFIIFEFEGLILTTVGIIGVGFFGFGFFVLLYRGLLDRRPRIVINEKGIYDRLLGVGRIDWEDIKSVKLNSSSTNSSISLKLLNSEKYLKNLSNLSKKISKFNGDLDFGILNLNLSGIDTKPQKIYEIILNRIPERRMKDLDSFYEIK